MRKIFSFVLFVNLVFVMTSCHQAEDIISDNNFRDTATDTVTSGVDITNESDIQTNTDSESADHKENIDIISNAEISRRVTDNSENKIATSTNSETSSSFENTAEEKVNTVSSAAQEYCNAAGEDSRRISELVIENINGYRRADGVQLLTSLKGLAEYAEYRSRQLVSNFSHNTDDERAAATLLKYGKYIEPELYGMTGSPYYTACAAEAIVKAGYAGDCEYVAASIARLVRESNSHWSYIGSSENMYIAVGITYESGFWYCDIAVSDVNYDK